MKVAVVSFPGSGGAEDASHAYGNVLGEDVVNVWHQEESIQDADLVVIPGGASFGDYLRPGALAKTSPIIAAIRKYAKDKRPIIGIGNGFQILCEAEILPGILLPNLNSRFLNTQAYVSVENEKSIWTKHFEEEHLLRLPLSCYNGRYYADKRALKDLEENGHVAFRFCDKDGDFISENPFNGSSNGIAGILNRHENVLGIIARPERAVEAFMGSVDGLEILSSVFKTSSETDENAIDELDFLLDNDDDDDDDF